MRGRERERERDEGDRDFFVNVVEIPLIFF